jgi:hypothetical protein
MKTFALLSILLVFCFSAPKCQKSGTPSLPPAQAAQARRAIVNYFECEECTAGEAEAVVKLGRDALPTLAATLVEGPPQTKLEVYRRQLTARYRELKEYEQTHPGAKAPGTEDRFVKAYLDSYVALYQVRAAAALGAIGGPESRRALEEAFQKPLRADVSKALKAALEKMN